jgi:hypothetical protein
VVAAAGPLWLLAGADELVTPRDGDGGRVGWTYDAVHTAELLHVDIVVGFV